MRHIDLARRTLSALALLVLAAGSAGAAASATSSPSGCAAAPALVLPSLDQILAPVPVKRGGEIGGPSEQSCTTQCWDGSTLTCSGPSCSAQYSDCATGERGYCQSGMFRQECPPCQEPECNATATCDGGGTAYCEGTNQCFANQGCYAYCDGIYVWCYGKSPSNCPMH